MVLLRGELTGAPVVVHERFEPAEVMRSLTDRAPAAVSLVAAMLSGLLELDGALDGCTLLVGGGPVDPSLVLGARERGARVILTYGMTETCGGVVYDGRPFTGTQVRIATGPDPAIEVRGPTLFSGYRGDPGATGGGFDVRGWFRTRDLGAFDDDGRLVVLGRADEAIRTGGETVWPEEVEALVRACPGVADVAVAGRPHPTWGQQVVAYVVPTDPADPPSGDRITSWVRERAAPFKMPRRTVVIDAVPRVRRAPSCAATCPSDRVHGRSCVRTIARAGGEVARSTDVRTTGRGPKVSNHAQTLAPGPNRCQHASMVMIDPRMIRVDDAHDREVEAARRLEALTTAFHWWHLEARIAGALARQEPTEPSASTRER